MDKRKLKGWLNKEDVVPGTFNKLTKYWDVILDWSSYDFYMTVKEIARKHKIRPKTVENRIYWFKRNYPEGYKKAQENRVSARAATLRQIRNIKENGMISYDALDPDIRDYLIKEKF